MAKNTRAKSDNYGGREEEEEEENIFNVQNRNKNKTNKNMFRNQKKNKRQTHHTRRGESNMNIICFCDINRE